MRFSKQKVEEIVEEELQNLFEQERRTSSTVYPRETEIMGLPGDRTVVYPPVEGEAWETYTADPRGEPGPEDWPYSAPVMSLPYSEDFGANKEYWKEAGLEFLSAPPRSEAALPENWPERRYAKGPHGDWGQSPWAEVPGAPDRFTHLDTSYTRPRYTGDPDTELWDPGYLLSSGDRKVRHPDPKEDERRAGAEEALKRFEWEEDRRRSPGDEEKWTYFTKDHPDTYISRRTGERVPRTEMDQLSDWLTTVEAPQSLVMAREAELNRAGRPTHGPDPGPGVRRPSRVDPRYWTSRGFPSKYYKGTDLLGIHSDPKWLDLDDDGIPDRRWADIPGYDQYGDPRTAPRAGWGTGGRYEGPQRGPGWEGYEEPDFPSGYAAGAEDLPFILSHLTTPQSEGGLGYYYSDPKKAEQAAKQAQRIGQYGRTRRKLEVERMRTIREREKMARGEPYDKELASKDVATYYGEPKRPKYGPNRAEKAGLDPREWIYDEEGGGFRPRRQGEEWVPIPQKAGRRREAPSALKESLKRLDTNYIEAPSRWTLLAGIK